MIGAAALNPMRDAYIETSCVSPSRNDVDARCAPSGYPQIREVTNRRDECPHSISMLARLLVGDERGDLPSTPFAHEFHTIARRTPQKFRVYPARAAVGDPDVTLLGK